MTYEPSKELIEQIAEEVYELNKCNLGWEDEIDFVKHHKLSFQNAKNYCKLPTFNKALELYENQPKWQDKPDKEGWYGVCVLTNDGKWFWLCPPQEPIGAYRRDGYMYIYYEDTEFPLSEFLKRYADYEGIKWLYIPEPEPYKGEE